MSVFVGSYDVRTTQVQSNAAPQEAIHRSFLLAKNVGVGSRRFRFRLGFPTKSEGLASGFTTV